MIPFVPPSFKVSAYHCPHCAAFAQQTWCPMFARNGQFYEGVKDLFHSKCSHCDKYSLWRDECLIYPATGTSSLPSNDLPENVKKDYEEARAILSQSPRGATALLRLAVQKLCIHLGEEGKNINADIKSMVEKGLPIKIQQSLDIVRVIGNNAVHPGQIDLTDDIETASKLFVLLNIIAEVMITQPNEIDKLFNSLPANQLAGIKQRDGNKGNS